MRFEAGGLPERAFQIRLASGEAEAGITTPTAWYFMRAKYHLFYQHNPVIDSKAKWNSKDTRDPKVFWYKPGNHWVLVLNERDGHSIYTSKNLKEWNFESHVTGFWECPELFELPDWNINSNYSK